MRFIVSPTRSAAARETKDYKKLSDALDAARQEKRLVYIFPYTRSRDGYYVLKDAVYLWDGTAGIGTKL